MDVLLLTAPTLDAFDNPLVETNPRKVGKWLDELPLLNPAETVLPVLAALRALNRQPLPEKDRVRLMELYNTAVNAIFNAFTLRALRQLPLPAPQREQIKLGVMQLCLELAGGYKSLIVQAHQQRRTPADEPGLLLLAFRALQQLVQTLLHCFRTYEPVPARVYLEIHQLYAWTEAAGAAATAVRQAGAMISMDTLYRSILLTCCVDPARLSEDEVVRVYSLLGSYAGQAQLLTGRCVPPHEGQFGFDLYSDAPPRPCGKIDQQTRVTQPRVLDARAVATAMRACIDAEANQGADDELRLLRLLLPHFEALPQRVMPRTLKQLPVLVATGIAALHYFLSDPRRLKQAAAEAREDAPADPASAALIDRHRLEAWLINNESDSGYLLCCAHRPTVRVGELLGVLMTERDDAPATLELTVVRWMRHGTENGLEIGVERLVGAAAAVICRFDADGAPVARQCLFLPSSGRQIMQATLLAPKRFYARGQRLHVEVGAKHLVVESGHLVMDTACFDRFVFHALGDADMASEAS